MRARDDSAFDDAMNPGPTEGLEEKDRKKKDDSRDGREYAESEIDEALDETFPASDPIAPSRIDGPKI